VVDSEVMMIDFEQKIIQWKSASEFRLKQQCRLLIADITGRRITAIPTINFSTMLQRSKLDS
jgi:hypothetical protein